MRALIDMLFRLTGHHLCCGRIPGWTAHVGQPWDTYDVAPFNLYNVLWRCQAFYRNHSD